MSNIPITVCGTVATVPQPRTLPTGRPCASFRLAVNHWRVDKQTGEFVTDTTSWFGIDCYGQLASNVGSSVSLGMNVVVQGHLRIRRWESGERSGIAPTIIADHLGPDLKYGTAHYVKVPGPNAAKPSSAPQAGEASSSGWGGIADDPAARVGAGPFGADGGDAGTFETTEGVSVAAATVSPGFSTDAESSGYVDGDADVDDRDDQDSVADGGFGEDDGRSGDDDGRADDRGEFSATGAGGPDVDDDGEESDDGIAGATVAAAAPF
ncbi:single-stranded DNA-binding protein [Brevibacterium metallidurans]|uniref:Single-stranded DNA-binding protein n=1 Tax=Brevibacterium metallidurans TaxID=1482676 RepID=A0ABN0SKC1_9MICO